MALNDLEIKKAKPGDKLRKLSDGGGLQLWVMPDGAKYWRLAYRFAEKQKVLAIGVYPATSLKDAREAREAARRLLAEGRDPSEAKRADRAVRGAAISATFNAIADELLAKKGREGKADRTLQKVEWLLSLARPALGARPIAAITAPEVLAMLRTVEARGRHDTANRLRATIGQVFRYAIATARASNDPTGALRGALTAPTVTHRPAITEPVAFGGLLRAIDCYHGAPETKAALELLALTVQRPGEVRSAEWAEFDLDRAVWEIPAHKMKKRRPHRLPLAQRAVAILREMEAITGGGRFVFPSVRTRGRCMSENTMTAALRIMGFGTAEMCAHGFRGAFSSMLNESKLFHPDAIERQLAHIEKNAVRRAYDRADHWDERVKMMGYWADRCDAMRRGGDVVQFKRSDAKGAV